MFSFIVVWFVLSLVIWLILSLLIGSAARQRGRSAFGWFLLSILTSPLIAGLFLLLFPSLRDPTINQLSVDDEALQASISKGVLIEPPHDLETPHAGQSAAERSQPSTRWYVYVGAKTYGPYVASKIAQMVERRQIFGSDKVYADGGSAWVSAADDPILGVLFRARESSSSKHEPNIHTTGLWWPWWKLLLGGLAGIAMIGIAWHYYAVSGLVTELINKETALNEKCRGGFGDNTETWKACDEREKIIAQLKLMGWCYGANEQAEYQKSWQQCPTEITSADTQASSANAKQQLDNALNDGAFSQPQPSVPSSVQPPAGATTKAASTSRYANISLTDLKLDRANLQGQEIEVSGFLQVMGEIVFLKDGLTDMSPIFVDISHASREGRKFALDCNLGCWATVRGIVGPVLMQPGIIAESLGRR